MKIGLLPSRNKLSVVSVLAFILQTACGSGGGSTVQTQVSSPDFSVTVNSSTLTLLPGTSGSIQVTLSLLSGFSGNVQVAITGLPNGINLTPASPISLTGGTTNISIAVSTSVPLGSYPVTLQATSGSLSHSTTATVTVAGPATMAVGFAQNSYSISLGQSITIPVLVSAQDGATNFQVQLTVSGLPETVSPIFSANPISAATSSNLTLTATTHGPSSSVATVVVAATNLFNGSTVSASFSLNVKSPVGASGAYRNDFLPLDSQPPSAVFDPIHHLVFASAPLRNRIVVVSSITEQIIKEIPVPYPVGLDLTLDNQQLLVGTRTNQFYTIDTSQLVVVARTSLPEVVTAPGAIPKFLQPLWPVATSNGAILFICLGTFPVGVYQWNPTTHALIARPDASSTESAHPARSKDGSKVLFYDPNNGGANVYDAGTDSFSQFQPALLSSLQSFSGVFPDGGAINPTGTQIALSTGGGPLLITDGNGNLLHELGGGLGSLYSADGTRLLVVSEFNFVAGFDDVSYILEILTYDTTSFGVVGTAPGYTSSLSNRRPILQPEVPLTVDDTGLIFGAADHGMAIDDSTNFQNVPNNQYQPQFVLRATPSEEPLNSSNSVLITTQTFAGLPTPQIFFGTQTGAGAQLTPAGQLQVNAPALSTPGPVNIRVELSSGILSYLPQGFTYGTVILPKFVQAVPSRGGVVADIYGYGLGIDLTPFNTQVTIGGQNAPITSHVGGDGEQFASYPFPVQHLQVAVPAGITGPADITVTTPVGSATMASGIRYLRSAQDFLSSSDVFTDLSYDSKRQRLYLSAGNHVDVFDLQANTFLSQISMPSIHGNRLAGGLTLTPDGTKLLVSNTSDSSIAVIDVDSPNSATAVGVAIIPLSPQCTPGPGQIAVTNIGKAYASIQGDASLGCGSRGLIELDISTLTASVRQDAALSGLISSGALLSGTRNGNALAITDFNNIFIWDPLDDTWKSRQLDDTSNLYDIAVPTDGTFYALRRAGNAFQNQFIGVDSGLNITASVFQPEYSDSTGDPVHSISVHDSGSLLYAVRRHGIKIYDVLHGDEVECILLPEQITSNFTHMQIDESGSRIYVLTDSGLTILQLDAIPLSFSTVNPPAGASTGRVTAILRGSGFLPGANVFFGPAPAATTFVDSNTLSVLVPETPTGPLQVKVQNPDGHTYILDAAYLAQ